MKGAQAHWENTIKLKGATNAGPVDRRELEVLEE